MSLYKYIQSHNDVPEDDMNTCLGGRKLCYLAQHSKLARFIIHEAICDVVVGAGRDGCDKVPV